MVTNEVSIKHEITNYRLQLEKEMFELRTASKEWINKSQQMKKK